MQLSPKSQFHGSVTPGGGDGAHIPWQKWDVGLFILHTEQADAALLNLSTSRGGRCLWIFIGCEVLTYLTLIDGWAESCFNSQSLRSNACPWPGCLGAFVDSSRHPGSLISDRNSLAVTGRKAECDIVPVIKCLWTRCLKRLKKASKLGRPNKVRQYSRTAKQNTGSNGWSGALVCNQSGCRIIACPGREGFCWWYSTLTPAEWVSSPSVA